MKLIETALVQVPEDRQRAEFDSEHIAELADSIQRIGLQNPIVLRNDGRTLVSGECRLRAVKLIFDMGATYKYQDHICANTIPFSLLEDLPDDLVIEAELDENLRRRNLSVQEQSMAIAKLHKLRQAANPDQTLGETGDELAKMGYASTGVSRALAIAENLDDPAVARPKRKAKR